MPATSTQQKTTIIANLSLAALVLNGCFLEEEPDELMSGGPPNELSGSVGDGPIVGAAVTIRINDGTLLMETESDAAANFIVTVSPSESAYPLTVDASGGIDLVTGLAPDFTLRSVVLEAATPSVANANPFATLAVEAATDMADGLTAANIGIAEAHVVSALGSGLGELGDLGTIRTVVDESNVAGITRASEALSEIIRRTRHWLLVAGYSIDADTVVGALGSDLTDGVVDGAGGPRADAHTAAIASIVGAQILLETAANELRVNGVVATTAMASAMQQIGFSAPEPSLEQLAVTTQMLEQIQTGLAAATAVVADARLDELRAALDGFQPGMSPEAVRNALPQGYRQTLDDFLVALSSADTSTIDAVNEIVREGQPPSPDNRPPVIGGVPPSAVAVGVEYRFVPSASDVDDDALTFSISNKPAWLSFNAETGGITGVPGASDTGAHPNIVIAVSDGRSSASLEPFSITVNAQHVNSPPSISGTPPDTVTEGRNYSFTPSASDADGDALSFSMTGKPAWLTFNASDGRISGVPGVSDVGTHSNIVISVSDGEASASLGPFSITVSAVPVNSPPTISGTPAASVTEGQAYSFVPSASDADGDALSFGISGKPAWLSFNASTGGISGTPGGSDVGTDSNIVITVSDGEDSASLGPFAITVIAENTGPSISGSPAGSVIVGENYSFSPTANDPDGDSLTFDISGKPAWLTFNSSTGTLNGEPAQGDVGIHGDIAISVSDGSETARLPSFSITVIEPETNEPPVISGSPATTVTAGTAYVFVPTASDPDGDALTFDISGLPAWATFSTVDGRLSGSPGGADVGTYDDIEISVSDGAEGATLGPFSITVDAISLGSVTLTWTAPTENTDGSPLVDLAGYKIYWGTGNGVYPNSVTLDNPGLTSHVVENLAPGTYEFVATSYNRAGVESSYSNTAIKVVQ